MITSITLCCLGFVLLVIGFFPYFDRVSRATSLSLFAAIGGVIAMTVASFVGFIVEGSLWKGFAFPSIGTLLAFLAVWIYSRSTSWQRRTFEEGEDSGEEET